MQGRKKYRESKKASKGSKRQEINKEENHKGTENEKPSKKTSKDGRKKKVSK